MIPVHDEKGVTIYHGDCVDAMRSMPADSVDSIVTDPPYGIRFMGKAWDGSDIEKQTATRRKYKTDAPGAGPQGGHNSAAVAAGKYDRKLSANQAFAEWTRVWSVEALRILKPGGHMLVFCGPRTYHRMVSGVEDAGFEIRDQIMWIYGQGFPKSLSIAKAIQDEFYQVFLKDAFHSMNISVNLKDDYSCNCSQCDEQLHDDLISFQEIVPLLDDVQGHIHHFLTLLNTHLGSVYIHKAFYDVLFSHLSKQDYPRHKGDDAWLLLLAISSFLCPACFSRLIEDAFSHEAQIAYKDWNNNDAVSCVIALAKHEQFYRIFRMSPEPYSHYIENINFYQEWGTALKPAHEPIVVARKPIDGTVAENVLKHGTGGINIDGGRIEHTGENFKRPVNHTGIHKGYDRPWKHTESGLKKEAKSRGVSQMKAESLGRFPANIILDPEAGAMLDKQSGESVSTGGLTKGVGAQDDRVYGFGDSLGANAGGLGDQGGASRFFYCAKASKADRDEGLEGMERKTRFVMGNMKGDAGQPNGYDGTISRNHHPTVKPTALMQYLCRLVTPPQGTVLDPFMGSGSTGKAAVREGFKFIGCEREAEYIPISIARINAPAQVKLI